MIGSLRLFSGIKTMFRSLQLQREHMYLKNEQLSDCNKWDMQKLSEIRDEFFCKSNDLVNRQYLMRCYPFLKDIDPDKFKNMLLLITEWAFKLELLNDFIHRMNLYKVVRINQKLTDQIETKINIEIYWHEIVRKIIFLSQRSFDLISVFCFSGIMSFLYSNVINYMIGGKITASIKSLFFSMALNKCFSTIKNIEFETMEITVKNSIDQLDVVYNEWTQAFYVFLQAVDSDKKEIMKKLQRKIEYVTFGGIKNIENYEEVRFKITEEPGLTIIEYY